MDTCRGRGPLGDASRARRASLLRLAGCDIVVRTLTTLPKEDRELVGTDTPLAEETPEVGRREKEDFPLAGTKATLVPGFISSGVPDKSSFWPADTITGVEPEDAVREAADTATAAEATWGLGRMERRPGAFWECCATTMTIGCSSGGCESSPSPVFRFLAAVERASNRPVHIFILMYHHIGRYFKVQQAQLCQNPNLSECMFCVCFLLLLTCVYVCVCVCVCG